MADEFLFFQFHLREGACFSIGDEQRVVTETHVADGRVVDVAAAFAFVNLRFAHDELAACIQGNSLVRKCAKIASLAVRDVFQVLHQEIVVGVILAVFAAVAGAVDSWFSVQGKNFKARIIGEDGGFDAASGEPFCRGA